MSTRTANAKKNTATVKSSTTAKSNGTGRKSAAKSAVKSQKSMTLHFVPDEKKPETKNCFRKTETGKEQAIGTLYLNREAAAVLGVDVNSKVKITIEAE